MPASTAEAKWIRRQTGDDDSSLPDDDLDFLFDDAVEEYRRYNRRIQRQAVVVQRLRELKIAAAPEVSYSEGDKRESMSDVFKHLDKSLEEAKAELDRLTSEFDSQSGRRIRMGGMKRNTRRRERP